MKSFSFVLALLFSVTASAEVGVTDTQIKIGVVNDMSGPDKDVASERMRGVLVAVKKANETKIFGRTIQLKRLDDKYDPKLTKDRTEELVEKEKVFALFAYNGTPQIKAVMPLLEREGIPMITPFSAADVLRVPYNPHIFPGRASASQEAEASVKYLVDDLKIKEISMLIQDDAFGEGGRTAVSQALEKRGLRVATVSKYKRESHDMTAQVKELAAVKPKALILFSIQGATFAFVKKWREAGGLPDTILIAGSAVEPMAAISLLGKDAEKLMLTSSIPPLSATMAIVKSFKDDMTAAKEINPTANSLEGYINGTILIEALKKAGKDLTRAGLKAAFEKMNPADLGGIEVAYSPELHRGLNNIYLTKIQDGKIISVK